MIRISKMLWKKIRQTVERSEEEQEKQNILSAKGMKMVLKNEYQIKYNLHRVAAL